MLPIAYTKGYSLTWPSPSDPPGSVAHDPSTQVCGTTLLGRHGDSPAGQTVPVARGPIGCVLPVLLRHCPHQRGRRPVNATQRFKAAARRSHPPQGVTPRRDVARFTTSPNPTSASDTKPGRRTLNGSRLGAAFFARVPLSCCSAMSNGPPSLGSSPCQTTDLVGYHRAPRAAGVCTSASHAACASSTGGMMLVRRVVTCATA